MSQKVDETQDAPDVDADALATVQVDRIEGIKQTFRNFKKDSITRLITLTIIFRGIYRMAGLL